MKKLLLTTTITCLAFSSMAEMSAKLHGKYEAQTVNRSAKSQYVSQPSTNSGMMSANQKEFKFNSLARIGVLLENKTDHGCQFGANIMLRPRTQDDQRYTSNIEKSFLFLEHKFGRLELGSNFDVATIMNIGARSIASATGGASDGDWSNYLPNPTINEVAFNPIIYGTNYIYAYSRDNGESERKISYMTPVLKGLQFGLSYTPDAANNGSNGDAPGKFNVLKDVVTIAMAYNTKKDDMDLGFSASYNSGSSTNNSYKLNDYNIGAKIAKNGFSAAVSYGDAGKSLQKKSNTTPPNDKYKANYYTAGVAYARGDMTMSLTYLASNKGYKVSNPNYTKLAAYSFGADYLLTKGFKLYAELTAFSVKDPIVQKTMTELLVPRPGPFPKNTGMVLLVGAAVKV